MRGRRARAGAALVAGALLLAGCGGGGKSYSGKSATSGDVASTTTPSTEVIGGINAVIRGTSTANEGLELEVDDNYFKPNILTGPAGAQVTLELANEGATIHNFSLTEQNVNQDVPKGGRASVKVTFPPSGDLVFFCRFHKEESGMVGVLRVAK
jgi:plastocyanin